MLLASSSCFPKKGLLALSWVNTDEDEKTHGGKFIMKDGKQLSWVIIFIETLITCGHKKTFALY